jgi:hypothetical protein
MQDAGTELLTIFHSFHHDRSLLTSSENVPTNDISTGEPLVRAMPQPLPPRPAPPPIVLDPTPPPSSPREDPSPRVDESTPAGTGAETGAEAEMVVPGGDAVKAEPSVAQVVPPKMEADDVGVCEDSDGDNACDVDNEDGHGDGRAARDTGTSAAADVAAEKRKYTSSATATAAEDKKSKSAPSPPSPTSNKTPKSSVEKEEEGEEDDEGEEDNGEEISEDEMPPYDDYAEFIAVCRCVTVWCYVLRPSPLLRSFCIHILHTVTHRVSSVTASTSRRSTRKRWSAPRNHTFNLHSF